MRDAAQRVGLHFLVGKNLRSRGLKNLLDLAVHFVQDRERVWILGVGVEAHLGNPEAIGEAAGIDLHVVGAESEPFAVSPHAHASRIQLLDLLLVGRTKPRQTRARTGARPAARVEVEPPPAQVFLVVLVPEVVARNIEARFARAVVIRRGTPGKLRQEALDVVEGHVLREISPERAARVRESLRILSVPGIEENSHRLDQRRRQHYHLAVGLVLQPVLGIDISHAASLARGRIHQDGVDGGVRAQGEIGKPLEFRNHHFERAVTRARIATVVARPTKVAGGAPVVSLAQDRERLGHDLDAELFRAFLDEQFAAAGVERRKQMLPGGRVVDVLRAAGDADQRLDLVVVRGHVFVADRPVFAPVVLHALGLEVERTEATA